MAGFKNIAEPKGKASKPVAHVQRETMEKSSMSEASMNNMPFISGLTGGSIQAKLTVGAPNDKFEVEADAMADQVMRMPAPTSFGEGFAQSPPNNSISSLPAVQKKCAACENESLEKEESIAPALQMKEIVHQASGDDINIQSKSTDSFASSSRPSETKKMSSTIQPNRDSGRRINRKVEEEDLIQKTENQTSGRGPPQGDFSSKLNQTKGSGQPLDSATNSFMSNRFGADFSNVRIHDNSTAASMSDSISAKAFTHQNNIYFNQGQYQPSTSSGKHLLAHELTHTIQQGAVGTSVQPKLEIGSPTSALEKEADSMADKVMRKPLASANSSFIQPKSRFNHAPSVQLATWDKEEQYNPYLANTAQNSVQRKNKRGPPSAISSDNSGKIRRGFWDDPLGSIGRGISSAVNFVGDSLSAGIDWVKGKLREMALNMPGYNLFTVVIGKDPITGQSVERTGMNFINAGLEVIPNGADYKRKLQESGGLQRAADWIDTQMQLLDFTVGDVLRDFGRFVSGISLTDIASPGDVLTRGINVFRPYVTRIFTFAGNVARKLLELVKEYVVTALRTWIQTQAPFYPLLTVVLGEDPITGQAVERNGMNILRGFIRLHPNGEAQLAQMQESGSLQRAATWIDQAIVRVSNIMTGLKNGFVTLWSTFTISQLLEPIATFNRIYTLFSNPVSQLIAFAIEVATMIIKFIKDALIARLVTYAKTIPGYNLVTVILGKDIFSQEPVERSTVNIIRGFMGLVPGGEEKFQELNQTGAITEAATWIEGAIAELNLTWAAIRGIFTTAWESFSLSDIAHPIETFTRVLNLFGPPIGRIMRFVGRVVIKLIEIALRIMGFPFALIGNIISNAQAAYNEIKNDPIKFLKNLLKAVKQGFVQFFGNILGHLVNGVGEWLFGQLGDAGITIPPDFSFQSILGMVFQILGITKEKIFDKLKQKVGPERWARIEGTINQMTGVWSFLSDIFTRGPIAIWEKIQEKLTGLWDTVVSAARGWIMTKIIEQVTVKLLSFLDPTGIMAVVNSFIAFFRAIQSAIQYMIPMLEMLNSFLGGIVQIAQGNIQPAADLLERTMARGMPILIGFLANQVGLGRIGDKIKEVIESIQAKVDEGLQWVIDKAWEIGGRLLEMGRNAVNTVRGWLGIEKQFTNREGESHKLYYHQTGQRGDLWMASDNPASFTTWIDRMNGQPETVQLHNLKDAHRRVVALKNDLENGNDPGNQAKIDALKTAIDALVPLIDGAGLFSAGDNVPLSNVTYEMNGGKAGVVITNPLTKQPGNTVGQDSSVASGSNNPLSWVSINAAFNNSIYRILTAKELIQISNDKASRYVAKVVKINGVDENVKYKKEGGTEKPVFDKTMVRAHVLNEGMHGPATAWNLAPASYTYNANMIRRDNELKTLIRESATPVLQLKIRVTYHESAAIIDKDNNPTDLNKDMFVKKIDYTDLKKGTDLNNLTPFTLTNGSPANSEVPQFNLSSADYKAISILMWIEDLKVFKQNNPELTPGDHTLINNRARFPFSDSEITTILTGAGYEDNSNSLRGEDKKTADRLVDAELARTSGAATVIELEQMLIQSTLRRSYSKDTIRRRRNAWLTANPNPPVSPKLKVGSPSDPLEAEADQMADRVMRMPMVNSKTGRSGERVQRKCSACEQEKLQRTEVANVSPQTVEPSFQTKLDASKPTGRPMDENTQAFMGERFGTNFENVSIHTDGNAAALSNQIQAKAFTTGNHIYFNRGEYQPETSAGKRLLAHELTHTIQQGAVAENAGTKSNGNSEVQRKCAACEQEEKVQRKCATCEKEEQVQRKCASCEKEEKIQRKCAACEKEEQVQRKCATCEQEEKIQRKCNGSCGEKKEVIQRSTHKISRGPPQIQRYSWGEFFDDVRGVGGAIVDGASAVGGAIVDGVTAVGGAIVDGATALYDAAVTAGRAIYNSVASVVSVLGSWAATAGAWLWEQIGRAAGWAWDRIRQFGSWVIDKFRQAYEFASRIARAIGAAVTFSGGVLTITGPNISLCPRMLTQFMMDPMSMDLPIAGLHWIGDHIEFLGEVGLQMSLTPEIGMYFGPCLLHNIFFNVDILGLSTTVGADLDLDIGFSLGGELQAGIYAEGDANLFFPPGSTTPIHVSQVRVEAGGAGQLRGALEAGHQFSFRNTVGLLSGIDMSLRDNAVYGISADLGLAGYGSLDVAGKNLCTLYYPIWEQHFSAAANVDYTMGLNFSTMGLPTITPSLDIDALDGVPFAQSPDAFDHSVLTSDCPICDKFRAMGILPKQVGVIYNGHPTPAWGGPLFAYPKDPKIPSGSLCRGACGPNCDPKACSPPVDRIECQETETGHEWHTYPNYTDCNSAPGCRQHDHCYDWCAAGGENSILGPCHRWCDLDCACDYDVAPCIDWALGGGSTDYTMPFSDPPIIRNGCRGGCPENIAAPGDPPQYQLCLPDFEIMAPQEFSDAWEHNTGRVNLYQTFVEVPYIVGLWLGVDAEAAVNASVGAKLGPVMLENVCMDVDPKTGIYGGSAELNAGIDLFGSIGLTGTVHGWAADFLCLLRVLEMSGSLIGTGSAALTNILSYVVDIECVNGEIRLVHELDLESCLNLAFDLDAAFDFKIFGLSAYSNQWDLADWNWEKCWDFAYHLPSFGEHEVPAVGFNTEEFDTIELIRSLFTNSTAAETENIVTPAQASATGILNPCGSQETPPGPNSTPDTVVENPLTAATAHTLAAPGGVLEGKLNRIRPTSTTLAIPGGHSSTVGIGMLTEYLTHQIAPGSEDIGNVQTPIYGFRKIPQKGAIKGGSGYTQDMVYIKGHLLNAQVGGPAQEDNLYPITGKANSDHKNGPEKWVKDNVNVNSPRLVVYYQVAVENRTAPTLIDINNDGACTYYGVNSTLTCLYTTYKLYNSGKVERNPLTRAPITSQHNQTGFENLVRTKGCTNKKSTDGSGALSTHEQEADTIARKVINNSVLPSGGAGIANSISKFGNGVQRKCGACGNKAKEVNLESLVQRKENGREDAGPISSNFESKLNSSKSTGTGMDPATRAEMETGFGANFENVNIHTDANAVALSNQIQAKAFTQGNDIYFNQGQYNPGTQEGKHLLAHELTHTIQQGASASKSGVSNTLQRVPNGDEVVTEMRIITSQRNGRYGGVVSITTNKGSYKGTLTHVSCVEVGGPYEMNHIKGNSIDKISLGDLPSCFNYRFGFNGGAPFDWEEMESVTYKLVIQGVNVPMNSDILEEKEAKEMADAVSTNPSGIADKSKEALDSAFTGTGVEAPKSDGFSGFEPSKEDSALMDASAKQAVDLQGQTIELDEAMRKAYEELKAKLPEAAEAFKPIDFTQLPLLNESFMLEGLLMGAGTESDEIKIQGQELIYNMSTIRELIADEINWIVIEMAAGVAVSAVIAFFTAGASLAVNAVRAGMLIRRLNKLRKLIDKIVSAYNAYENIKSAFDSVQAIATTFIEFREGFQELKGKYDVFKEKVDKLEALNEEETYAMELAEFELISAIQLQMEPGGKLENLLEFMIIPEDADLGEVMMNIPAGIGAMSDMLSFYSPGRKPDLKYATELMKKGFRTGKLLYPFVGFVALSVNEKIESIKADNTLTADFGDLLSVLGAGHKSRKSKLGSKSSRKKESKAKMDKVKKKKPEKPAAVIEKEKKAKKAEEDAAKKKKDEDAAKKKADEDAAKKKLDEDPVKKKTDDEEEKKKLAEDDKKKLDEEAAKKKLEEEEAKKKVEEDPVKKKADEEAAKKKAEEEENTPEKKAEREKDDLWRRLTSELDGDFATAAMTDAVTPDKIAGPPVNDTIKKTIYNPVSGSKDTDDYTPTPYKIRFTLRRKDKHLIKYVKETRNMLNFAKNQSGFQHYFKPMDLEALLRANGAPLKLKEDWKTVIFRGRPVMRVLSSGKKSDPKTTYTFYHQGGLREVPKHARREVYGFSTNVKKDGSDGLKVMKKGFTSDAWDETQKTKTFQDAEKAAGKKYNKADLDGDKKLLESIALFQNARWKNGKTTKTALTYPFFGWEPAIMGHDDSSHIGASGYWNATGNKFTRSENMIWNKDPVNYWGPEHTTDSSASGSSAPEYEDPTKKSNQMWWDSSYGTWPGHTMSDYTIELTGT